MLTDIFADRYKATILWEEVKDSDTKFLTQAFRIIEEQIYPYYYDGKVNEKSKEKWELFDKKLSMELGLNELSSKTFGYNTQINGNTRYQVFFHPAVTVCKNFVCALYDGSVAPDRFMKERLSFIELAFRERAQELDQENINLPKKIAALKDSVLGSRTGVIRLPGDPVVGMRAWNEAKNKDFSEYVSELNTRLRQAGYNLNYHNGIIQISSDNLSDKEIEKPFWSLVNAPEWKNVDTDIKEAIDLRDNDGRDPAFYAARALESAIKIISDRKGWTHDKEIGAQNYLDNLAKKGNSLIDDWEKKSLEDFFRSIRNPFSHGAGSKEMPKLTPQQIDWAIGFCMLWIRSLIQRI